ncbi:AAA family ATPase [Streptomyces sp. NPDC005402]|uniref:AAA family ATPase n=1 Tax=Streptomyces sp. NPDC005402 TaxID=3155338 RepID=UPI0033B32FB3
MRNPVESEASLAVAGRGVTVLGAAAGTGKSGVSIGISRTLDDRGIRCVPFKAVAVVAPNDPAYPAVPPWQRGILHNCGAARTQVRWWNNPVVVNLPAIGAHSGDLYVRGRRIGEVPVAGEDSLDLGALPERLRQLCVEAAHEGFARASADGGWLVVEGAAGVGELAPSVDLANQILPEHAGLPTLLVTNPQRSGHLAALAGSVRLLSSGLRAQVCGYVLNQVRRPEAASAIGERLSAATGLPLLGVIGESPLPVDYNGSAEMLESLYRRRANFVAASGLIERLSGGVATSEEVVSRGGGADPDQLTHRGGIGRSGSSVQRPHEGDLSTRPRR